MQTMLSRDQVVLLTLGIQLGMMASLATIMIQFRSFDRIVLKDRKDLHDTFNIIGITGVLFGLGVAVRIFARYEAFDVSLPGTLLIGLAAGPIAGIGVGTLASLPALLNGEFLTLGINVIAGISGGVLYLVQPSQRKRMDFSPIIFVQLYRFSRDWIKSRQLNWSIIPLSVCMILEGTRLYLTHEFGHRRIFGLQTESLFVNFCIIAASAGCLGIPLKIWNNRWMEQELRAKEYLLTKARLNALKNQINPHFLFNTLNTISASIRRDPEQARAVVFQLSLILRSLLERTEAFERLESEMAFIKSYLAIEEIRFGKERLRVIFSIDPATLPIEIPSMLLQPIVENALRHGISPKVEAGTIRITTRKLGPHLQIIVEDDGVGIPTARIREVKETGIGLSNIEERLKVLYGEEYKFIIESRPHQGTRVMIVIPETPAVVEEPTGNGEGIAG
ncbi:MAG: sensor histidine kinase [Deltaproteobacteria bacterium]|nr:MAG: sensor histidine kinase [Deltaproteobacteria bacterium]